MMYVRTRVYWRNGGEGRVRKSLLDGERPIESLSLLRRLRRALRLVTAVWHAVGVRRPRVWHFGETAALISWSSKLKAS